MLNYQRVRFTFPELQLSNHQRCWHCLTESPSLGLSRHRWIQYGPALSLPVTHPRVTVAQRLTRTPQELAFHARFAKEQLQPWVLAESSFQILPLLHLLHAFSPVFHWVFCKYAMVGPSLPSIDHPSWRPRTSGHSGSTQATFW